MKIFMIGEAGAHREKLQASLSEPLEIVPLPREAAYLSKFDNQIEADDIVISLRWQRPVAPGPKFRLLHIPGAGLDQIDQSRLSPDCMIANVFEHEIPIAEYVLLAVLNWEIGLQEMRQSFTPETWSATYRKRVPHGEAFGKSIALIGYGRIGHSIAVRAKAFGMRVLILDPALSKEPGVDRVVKSEQLSELLVEADYLVVACPLTDETRNMIGTIELAQMKSSAVVINISRAEVIAEAALYQALRDGIIAGAVLDVWYRYPKDSDEIVPPSSQQFHALPNVIATPHSCAWTRDLPWRRYGKIAENIRRLRSGEPLLNLVRAAQRDRS